MPGTYGLAWIIKYDDKGGMHNLPESETNATGLKALSGSLEFEKGNDEAVDVFFEQAKVGQKDSGLDAEIGAGADTVDLVYFSGHGTRGSLAFRPSNQDDGYAKATEMRLGDGQLKWLVVDGCELLQDGSAFGQYSRAIDRWQQVFRGLRMILGFASQCHDYPDRGKAFAVHLNNNHTLRWAWKKACIETESAATGTRWAYMRSRSEDVNTYYDRWNEATLGSEKPHPVKTYFLGSGDC